MKTSLLRLTPCMVLIVVFSGCSRTLPPSVSTNDQSISALRKQLGPRETEDGDEPTGPEATGFATIVGTFTINGAAPVMGLLPTDGNDRVACGDVPNETVVVDSASGGIRDVLIYCTTKTKPEWEHPDYQQAKTAVLDYDQRGCRFLSHVFAMRSTQSLNVMNTDNVGHNTNFAPPSGARTQSKTTAIGGTTPYEPGGQTDAPFTVTCDIHRWMKAWLITRDNPYFAVTDAQGKFTIKNVPAGEEGFELEFRAWQEKIKYLGSVTVNGEPVTWRRGKFKLPLKAGQEYQLNVVINASEFN